MAGRPRKRPLRSSRHSPFDGNKWSIAARRLTATRRSRLCRLPGWSAECLQKAVRRALAALTALLIDEQGWARVGKGGLSAGCIDNMQEQSSPNLNTAGFSTVRHLLVDFGLCLSFSLSLLGCGDKSSDRAAARPEVRFIHLHNQDYRVVGGEDLKKLITGSRLDILTPQFEGYFHEFHQSGQYYGKMELEHGGRYHFTSDTLCIDDLYDPYCNYILSRDNRYFLIRSGNIQPEYIPNAVEISAIVNSQ